MSSIPPVPPPRSQAADSRRPGATINNRSGNDDEEAELRTPIGDVIAIAGVIVLSLATLTVIMMCL